MSSLPSILNILKMRINFSALMLGFCILFIASCSKDEGEGGTSTIKGKVVVKKYDNSYHTLLSIPPLPLRKIKFNR